MNHFKEIQAPARSALNTVREELLRSRHSHGHWEGHLSSSALSTATAISALSAILLRQSTPADGPEKWLIQRGIEYLRGQQNRDGGFGDTDRSHSNIATSYLVLAASELARQSIGQPLVTEQTERLTGYIENSGGMDGLRQRYGKDKTFVVPILSNMAIAGLIDWETVPALPFEAAAFPQSMYRFLRVPVVSYAIPALVAIGQAKHFHCPTGLLPLRWARSSVIRRTLDVLQRMQPESGGYLEATPLTSFVLMSLASAGRPNHAVCTAGTRFLNHSVRDDGSWPIDTNLATWVTSLSIGALLTDPQDRGDWITNDLVAWLLSCQHQTRHPFTGAEPGGWGWTNLSGAVPDGDDTPAAILALEAIEQAKPAITDDRISLSKKKGMHWLQKLQNRNGGIPTFCRGWGKLPFDRSSVDLTAHALRAWSSGSDDRHLPEARSQAIDFLAKNQHHDGSWAPLWFGNQDRENEDNPIYGTAKVLVAAEEIMRHAVDTAEAARMLNRGADHLVAAQNADGGWGGGTSAATIYGLQTEPDWASTVEETALALEGLIEFRRIKRSLEHFHPAPESRGGRRSQHQTRAGATEAGATAGLDQAILLGAKCLCNAIDAGLYKTSFPIGFYFAKLWYHEQLYPLIYSAAALGRLMSQIESFDPNIPAPADQHLTSS